MDFDHTDNGFLRLDHVRIPRENMLSRFAQVGVLGRMHACTASRGHRGSPETAASSGSSSMALSSGYHPPQRGSGVAQTWVKTPA